MEDFYIGGASVKLFLPIFKMNFPEIVDIALPAEGVFHNLVSVSIKKTYPMQAYKSPCGRPPTSTTPAKCCSISRPTPIRSATTWWPSARTHQRPV